MQPEHNPSPIRKRRAQAESLDRKTGQPTPGVRGTSPADQAKLSLHLSACAGHGCRCSRRSRQRQSPWLVACQRSSFRATMPDCVYSLSPSRPSRPATDGRASAELIAVRRRWFWQRPLLLSFETVAAVDPQAHTVTLRPASSGADRGASQSHCSRRDVFSDADWRSRCSTAVSKLQAPVGQRRSARSSPPSAVFSAACSSCGSARRADARRR